MADSAFSRLTLQQRLLHERFVEANRKSRTLSLALVSVLGPLGLYYSNPTVATRNLLHAGCWLIIVIFSAVLLLDSQALAAGQIPSFGVLTYFSALLLLKIYMIWRNWRLAISLVNRSNHRLAARTQVQIIRAGSPAGLDTELPLDMPLT